MRQLICVISPVTLFSGKTGRIMSPEETRTLKELLATNNNRTLVCNGSQLPHVAERGLEVVADIGRPHVVPEAAVQWVESTSTRG